MCAAHRWVWLEVCGKACACEAAALVVLSRAKKYATTQVHEFTYRARACIRGNSLLLLLRACMYQRERGRPCKPQAGCHLVAFEYSPLEALHDVLAAVPGGA